MKNLFSLTYGARLNTNTFNILSIQRYDTLPLREPIKSILWQKNPSPLYFRPTSFSLTSHSFCPFTPSLTSSLTSFTNELWSLFQLQ